MLSNLMNKMVVAASLPDAGSAFDWIKGQAQYLVYGFIIYYGVKFMMKKEIGKGIGIILGAGLLSFFMFNPQIVVNLGKAVANLLGVN